MSFSGEAMDEQMDALRAQFASLAEKETRLRVKYSATKSEMRGVLKAMVPSRNRMA